MIASTATDDVTINIAEMFNGLVAELSSLGYIIRKVGKAPYTSTYNNTIVTYNKISARHDVLGVKVTVESEMSKPFHSEEVPESLTVIVDLRNSRGRFVEHDRTAVHIRANYKPYNNQDTPEKWFNGAKAAFKKLKGAAVTDALVTGGLAAFAPLNFRNPGYSFDKDMNAMMHCFYRSCRVIGVATIMPDLKVSMLEASTPGNDTWFYLIGECMTRGSSASPEIVVKDQDGELVFYPVRQKRVHNDLKPSGTYIDFTEVSELDAVLVMKAIAKFLQG